MAGHSKWSKVKRFKGALDTKRGALFSKLSREINAVTVPRRADIVLIDAHPADRDFWQSAKGFYSGTMAVQEGGTLIVNGGNVALTGANTYAGQ